MSHVPEVSARMDAARRRVGADVQVVRHDTITTVPSRARVYYKAVAVVGNELRSIYDGTTVYVFGVKTFKASGIWVCPDLDSLIRHMRRRLPRRSALADAPRVVLRVLGWDEATPPVATHPSVEKLAVTSVVPTAVLPYSAEGIPDGWTGPQRAAVNGSGARSRPRSAEARMSSAAAWRQFGGGGPQSERMQAITAQLHEDVAEAQARLRTLQAGQESFHHAASGWVDRAMQADAPGWLQRATICGFSGGVDRLASGAR